jgi:hypothetical protein
MGHHYLDVIGASGLTAVRHRDERVTLSYPVRTRFGVYKLYETMNLRRAKCYNYIEKGRILLEEAMKRQAAYHIWFHPSDATEVFEGEFYSIIKYMAELRDQGRLWIATMSELAAYCEARERVNFNVERNSMQITIRLRNDYDVKRYGAIATTLRIQCDAPPRQCWMWNGGGRAAVSWKEDKLNTQTTSARSILLNVPSTAEKVLVAF